jgi:hypothetical protein
MTLLPSPKLKLKTDNQSLGDKTALRRKLIKQAGLEPLRVLDLFAGEGTIWGSLRQPARLKNAPEALNVESYTPIDSVARQPGQIRFKITPRLIAALDEGGGLSRYNCVDVDCFGDPFAIWQALLFRIRVPTAVFLTRGRVTYGAGRMPISKLAKKVMGIPEEWDVPGKVELMEYGDRCQLLQPCPTAKIAFGYKITLRRVDYYALLVKPTEAHATT